MGLVRLAVAALTAASVGASPAFANDSDERTVLVFTHFQDDGMVTPGKLECDGGQSIHGHATFGLERGDTWRGTSVYDICLTPGPTPDTLTFHGVETVTGSVTGCGAGTMTYRLTDGFVKLEPNPMTPNGTQVWQIVPGTGMRCDTQISALGGWPTVSRGSFHDPMGEYTGVVAYDGPVELDVVPLHRHTRRNRSLVLSSNQRRSKKCTCEDLRSKCVTK